MQKIYLYEGRCKNKKTIDVFVLVDDENFDELNKHKWCMTRQFTQNIERNYAKRCEKKEGKFVAIYMHRVILNLTNKKDYCDHINGNGLDNRNCNLRKCTQSQNMINRKKVSGCSSQFVGVCFRKDKKKKQWAAKIKMNGVSIYGGHFYKEVDAALAYNSMAIKYHGEFARLNIIPNGR